MDLNQITLPARDLAESVAFYRRLGLRLIVLNAGEYARFELPSGSTTLSLFQTSDPPGSAVTYFEVDDIDRRHAELETAGIVFDAPPQDQPWRWREAHFADPAGNLLCLFHAGPDRRFPPWRLDTDRE